MASWERFHGKLVVFGIAALCFGYFASYVPFSMMTKMVTAGLLEGMNGVGFSGFSIQPITLISTCIVMYAFLTIVGWWKYATHSKVFGISIPRPQWFTFVSGLCTGGIIVTTVMAYTFKGISIVFAMLLMRGGVLIMAPIVDVLARKRRRKIYWPSWIAALLSFGALIVAFTERVSTEMTTLCAVDIALYLACYFIRFFFMSNRAKSNDVAEKKRYFTEEQMTANLFIAVAITIVGLIGSTMDPQSMAGQVWYGFTVLPSSGYLFHIVVIAVGSFGAGLFGNLIYLDKREHTFCIPANRVSSVIAGVVATYALAVFYGQSYPSAHQLVGVALILIAIVFLSYRPVVEKRQRANAKCRVKAETPEAAAKKVSGVAMQPAMETE